MELLLAEVSRRFERIDIPDHDAIAWNPRGDRQGIWGLPAAMVALAGVAG